MPPSGRLLQQKIYFLKVVEVGSPSPVCEQSEFLLRLHAQPAGGWPPSCCALTRPFLCMSTSLVSLLTRTVFILDYNPTLVTSFNWNYLFKGPKSGLQHMGFGEDSNLKSMSFQLLSQRTQVFVLLVRKQTRKVKEIK